MKSPFKTLTKKEWFLWLFSLTAVLTANLVSAGEPLTLAAALIGVTSLVLMAKGNVWGQLLMVIFSILYGIISFRFRYWGEMFTYLGMTLPMSVWAAITWFRNPSKENKDEIAIFHLGRRHIVWLLLSGSLVTAAFYLLLAYLDTPNLIFSTVSIITSFLAAALTMLRSSYYALGYAANDLVLIVLWSLAALEDPSYAPVVVNFAIFFLNDMYGFVSWKKREKKQSIRASSPEGSRAA